MNWRNFKLLIIGGGLCLVLLIASLVMLVIFGGKHRQVNSDLEASLDSLKRLKSSSIYPSQANLQVVKRNIEEVELFKGDYLDALGSAQIEAIDGMSRTKFMAYFEEVRRDLQRYAAKVDEEKGKAKVKLPVKFGFGFETYLAGVGPKQSVVPRLTVQLQSVESVCKIMFDLGVDSLLAVKREEFEVGVKENVDEMERNGRSSGRKKPARKVEDNRHLYSRDCFTFRFSANEATTWRVIDALSSDATPMMIQEVTMENLNKALQPKLTQGKKSTRKASSRRGRSSRRGGKPKAEDKAKLMEEAPVVAGEELVQTTLKVCLYRYVQGASDAGAAE